MGPARGRMLVGPRVIGPARGRMLAGPCVIGPARGRMLAGPRGSTVQTGLLGRLGESDQTVHHRPARAVADQ
eukprot:1091248-Pyramimonas_sp.AAC.1